MPDRKPPDPFSVVLDDDPAKFPSAAAEQAITQRMQADYAERSAGRSRPMGSITLTPGNLLEPLTRIEISFPCISCDTGRAPDSIGLCDACMDEIQKGIDATGEFTQVMVYVHSTKPLGGTEMRDVDGFIVACRGKTALEDTEMRGFHPDEWLWLCNDLVETGLWVWTGLLWPDDAEGDHQARGTLRRATDRECLRLAQGLEPFGEQDLGHLACDRRLPEYVVANPQKCPKCWHEPERPIVDGEACPGCGVVVAAYQRDMLLQRTITVDHVVQRARTIAFHLALAWEQERVPDTEEQSRAIAYGKSIDEWRPSVAAPGFQIVEGRSGDAPWYRGMRADPSQVGPRCATREEAARYTWERYEAEHGHAFDVQAIVEERDALRAYICELAEKMGCGGATISVAIDLQKAALRRQDDTITELRKQLAQAKDP